MLSCSFTPKVTNFPKSFRYEYIGFNILGTVGFEPTDVEEIAPEYFSDIKVYPNPASEYAILEFTLLKNARTVVGIYDMQGQLVKQQVDQNLAPGTWQSAIHVDALPAGFYLVTIKGGREVKNAKLVVIK